MRKKKTTEDFKKEVYDKVKDEYEVLGDYTGANSYIKIRHAKCDYIYKVTPNNFLKGRRCPNCFATKKKTLEQFKQEVYNLVGNEYEVIGEYINTDTNIEMKHKVCGHTFQVMPKHFLYKNARCPICLNRNRMTFEEFKIKFYEAVGDEYKIIGNYIDTNIPIEIKHIECDHSFNVKPKSFLNNSVCPNCVNKKNKKSDKLKEAQNRRKYSKKSRPNRKTTKQFKKEVYDLVGDEYIVLSKYINNKTHIKMRHNKCGHVYTVKPYQFLGNKRCPKCNSSKGELSIARLLDKHKINYKHDKPYGGCSYKNALRFDFLIFDKNENLKLIVEFDGIQHFEPATSFGGEENFNETLIRDEIKNEFCKENNINLLRIPYWDINNIDEILYKELCKLKLI